MKRRLNKLKWIAIISIIFSAQFTFAQKKTYLHIESDAFTFLMKGYSLHVSVNPFTSKKILVGIATDAFKQSGINVYINSSKEDLTWNMTILKSNVIIKNSFSIFTEYYFRKITDKWFIGAKITNQTYRFYQDPFYSSSINFQTRTTMIYAGYAWRPIKYHFYLKPSLGIEKYKRNMWLKNAETKIWLIPRAAFQIGYFF